MDSAKSGQSGSFVCVPNPGEPYFTLLGRDKASAAAIRYWCLERIKTGKNTVNDPQIIEAYQRATEIEEYQARLAAPQTPKVDTL